MFFVLAFLTCQKPAFGEVTVQAKNCLKQAPGSPVLYLSDFRWWYNPIELLEKLQEVYTSVKRLDKRAYLDTETGRIMLPYDRERGGDVELPLSFVEQVAMHIRSAFAEKVIDGVFFSDMGHSHFYFPAEKYQEIYFPIPITQASRMYESFFKDPDLRVLYHTAEQLRLLDENNQPLQDERLLFRLKTRNLVGRNDGSSRLEYWQAPGTINNTVNEVEGYDSWSSGFNISSNQNGCFSFEAGGKNLSFDLSLYDLPSKPEEGGFGDNF